LPSISRSETSRLKSGTVFNCRARPPVRIRAALPTGLAAAAFTNIPPKPPAVAEIKAALAAYQAEECDGIIGLGGG